MRWLEEAITAHQRAGEIFRDLTDRHGEGQAWNNLGVALRQVRRFDEAITAHQQDIAICAELGDYYGQDQTLENLGFLHAVLEQPEPARSAWAQAIELDTAAGADEDAARVRERIFDPDR